MKIGVALAGGGLKGVAHIGALKALEELGLDIDYITGTSSGAMMAALYAMGYTPDEMKDIVKESYKKITRIRKRVFIKSGFIYILKRKINLQGIIDGKRIEELFKYYARKKEIYKISDIKKGFAMITADAKTTRKCVLVSGKIYKRDNLEYIENIPIEKAVHASMAFPAIFTPCKYDKYCFIDGGTVDNLPVETLKDLGAEKTIALSFKLDEYTGDENLFSNILRACDIFSLRDVKAGQEASDINIEINMDQAKLLEIKNIEESIQLGYNEVMKNKEKILGLVKI